MLCIIEFPILIVCASENDYFFPYLFKNINKHFFISKYGDKQFWHYCFPNVTYTTFPCIHIFNVHCFRDSIEKIQK